jgi:hypothetical protein
MTTTITIIANDGIGNDGGISKQAYFALCNSCFWCASSLDGRLSEICPSCKSKTINSIAIAGKETLAHNCAIRCE